jgi:hypothetical protein
LATLHSKAQNPTTRTAEPYKEGSKNNIHHGRGPYKKGGKTVPMKKKTKNKMNNNNKAKNNTTTTKDVELVDNPVDNKSNHNRRCPKRQKVSSLDPIPAII